MSVATDCLFCKIISGVVHASLVYDDAISLAFLDHRPLFSGHSLLVPKIHVETLSDLPHELVGPIFQNVQLLARAVEAGMDAQGSFLAINNKISQSVPHLHIHVVPRRKKDGLKGFFWPRTKYQSDEELDETRLRIVSAVRSAEKHVR